MEMNGTIRTKIKITTVKGFTAQAPGSTHMRKNEQTSFFLFFFEKFH
jgi:hypothetical protein